MSARCSSTRAVGGRLFFMTRCHTVPGCHRSCERFNCLFLVQMYVVCVHMCVCAFVRMCVGAWVRWCVGVQV